MDVGVICSGKRLRSKICENDRENQSDHGTNSGSLLYIKQIEITSQPPHNSSDYLTGHQLCTQKTDCVKNDESVYCFHDQFLL